MNDPVHPLTEDHLANINHALEQIKLGLQQVALATSAGIDVATQKASLLDTQGKLLAIKQVYFPGR